MDAPKGLTVDHINHNTTDNRRENLRLCTIGENKRNSLGQPRGRVSKYKGVYRRRGSIKKPWRSQIYTNGVKTYIGDFKTEESAATAYNAEAIKQHGEFALLNNIGNNP
jgi:hypothetical protein